MTIDDKLIFNVNSVIGWILKFQFFIIKDIKQKGIETRKLT